LIDKYSLEIVIKIDKRPSRNIDLTNLLSGYLTVVQSTLAQRPTTSIQSSIRMHQKIWAWRKVRWRLGSTILSLDKYSPMKKWKPTRQKTKSTL